MLGRADRFASRRVQHGHHVPVQGRRPWTWPEWRTTWCHRDQQAMSRGQSRAMAGMAGVHGTRCWFTSLWLGCRLRLPPRCSRHSGRPDGKRVWALGEAPPAAPPSEGGTGRSLPGQPLRPDRLRKVRRPEGDRAGAGVPDLHAARLTAAIHVPARSFRSVRGQLLERRKGALVRRASLPRAGAHPWREARPDRPASVRQRHGAAEGDANLEERQAAGGRPAQEDVGQRYRPSYTRLRAPGCYAYQVDGTTFSRVIVFQAELS